ncbi:hypothetical protein OXT66_07455 [Lentilactobacillus senioris]|nr:hypothetical protein [Lentilactobacillus senioris]MCY9807368.1 hypothetical protein [Lentilactobacillus senioris]
MNKKQNNEAENLELRIKNEALKLLETSASKYRQISETKGHY